jgi:hypothetical protein
MDISNFGETDHKKYIVIINCDTAGFTTEYLPTRPLKKITIIVPKDTDDTTNYVIEEIKKENTDFNRAIVRVEISLATPELKSVSKSVIEKFLMDQGTFNVTNILESKKIALIKKITTSTIDTKMDVVAAIKTYAHTYTDASVRDSFIELAMDIVNTYKAEAKE